MPRSPEVKQLNIPIPKQVHLRLKRAAARNGRTLTGEVRYALTIYAEAESKR